MARIKRAVIMRKPKKTKRTSTTPQSSLRRKQYMKKSRPHSDMDKALKKERDIYKKSRKKIKKRGKTYITHLA